MFRLFIINKFNICTFQYILSLFCQGLPRRFCEEHLKKIDYKLVLEDEKGSEYDVVYLSKKTALSGGWRAFALKQQDF